MQRRDFIATCAAVTALSLTATSGRSAAESIAGDFAGTDWVQWSEVKKYWYVWGFRAGQNSGAVTALDAASVKPGSDARLTAERRVGVPASVAQIVSGLDVVCGDYRNQSIPLWVLATYVVESISGVSNEQSLDDIRRSYGSGSGKTSSP